MTIKIENFIKNKSINDNQIPRELYNNLNENLSIKFIQYMRKLLNNDKLEYIQLPKPIFEGQARLLYRFQLNHNEPFFSQPLILRIYQDYIQDELIQFESTIQNILYETNYPAPRVLHYNNDKTLLGGAFLIMEEISGKNMTKIIRSHPFSVLDYTKILTQMQIKLHSIKAEPIITELDQQGFDLLKRSSQGVINYINSIIDKKSLENIKDAQEWIIKNKPIDSSQKTICHADFHFGNILMNHEMVSGVVDWGNTVFDYPEHDMASTRILLNRSFRSFPKRYQILLTLLRKYIIFSYMSKYKNSKKFDMKRIQYFEALICLKKIILFYDYDAVVKKYEEKIKFYKKHFEKLTHKKIPIKILENH